MRFIRDRGSKRTIIVRTGGKPWFNDRCVLAYRAKQKEYRVWSHSRTQAAWEEYRMTCRRDQVVYEDYGRTFTEESKSILTNALNPRKWWSTMKMAVFGASSSLPPLVDRVG